MSERKGHSHKKLFYLLAALLSLQLYMALMVIVGWYIDSVTLTQVLPQFAPMQFNTALGFVLSAAGLAGLLLERQRLAVIAGVLLLLLSGVTLFQYLTGSDTGLDQLFVKVEAQARTSHPGRPSPNTTFCFLLTALLLCSELFADRLKAWPQRYWLTGVILCFLALLTWLGYVIEVPTHYGWGHLMRMAVHTAAGFMLTGLVLLGLVWLRRGVSGGERRQLITLLVATLGFMIALLDYQIIVFVQEKNIREQKQYQMELLASHTANHILSRVSAFERLAERRIEYSSPVSRQRDIRDYMQDMPDLLSVGVLSLATTPSYQRLDGRSWVILPDRGALESLSDQRSDGLAPTALRWQRPYLWVLVNLGLSDQALLFQLDLEQQIQGWKKRTNFAGNNSLIFVSTGEQELADLMVGVSYLDPLQISRELKIDNFSLRLTFVQEPRLLFKTDHRITAVFLVGLAMAMSLALAVNWFMRNGALQRQLTAIQNASTTGLIGSDLNGRIRFCNRSAQDMFGYNQAQLLSMNIEDLLPPDMRGYHVNLRAGLQAQRVSRKLESRRLSGYDSRGETFPLDIGIGFTETERGTMVISSLVDMRPQRKLEADLSARNTQLTLLLNSVGEGIYGVDVDGMCTFVNPAACQMLGYGEEQLLDSFIHDLIQYKDAQGKVDDWQHSTIYQVLCHAETIEGKEEIYWRRDGSSFFVEFVASPITVEGKVRGAVVVFSDITAKREFEKLQQQHTDKLQQINQELEEFNYVASHDLKEPLRTLKSFCAFLEDDLGEQPSEEVKRDLRFINQATDRMQMLINDLLEYSRAGSQTMAFERVDLNSMMARIQENLRAAVEESGATLQVSHLPAVLGDAPQLERVFQNLISNAIKFHGEQPPQINITASLDNQSGRIVIAVQDNGEGIPEQYQEQIFGAFKRLHTMDEVEGTGIGLAVVKKLVERHNGRIWVNSREGVGSTFFVELPAYRT